MLRAVLTATIALATLAIPPVDAVEIVASSTTYCTIDAPTTTSCDLGRHDGLFGDSEATVSGDYTGTLELRRTDTTNGGTFSSWCDYRDGALLGCIEAPGTGIYLGPLKDYAAFSYDLGTLTPGGSGIVEAKHSGSVL
ncbi:MAG: hypothetical protein WDA16_08315 [Candidatus Thermoplasmatota archaeon]